MTSFIQPDMWSPDRAVRDWPFGHLEPQAYSLIMIDCAWRFLTRSKMGEVKSPQSHYRTMTLDQIRALPVGDLAAEDCLLWMWGTAPMANVQPDILRGWGFKFGTEMVWLKTTVTGKMAFGLGYLARNCHEPVFIGTRGNPEIVKKHRSVFTGLVREHSRKPDEAYAIARDMVPYGRAADVYSRENRVGWESFGDEAGKFNEEDAA